MYAATTLGPDRDAPASTRPLRKGRPSLVGSGIAARYTASGPVRPRRLTEHAAAGRSADAAEEMSDNARRLKTRLERKQP